MKDYKVPIGELKFSFSKSSGAGGQNVNKVNTKVTLKWDIGKNKSLSKAVKERFKNKYQGYLFDGTVIIKSQKFRDQSRNIADCVNKLNFMIEAIKTAPKKRISTNPTKAAVEKRLRDKRKLSEKKGRRKTNF